MFLWRAATVPAHQHVQDPVARVQGNFTQQVSRLSVSCSIQGLSSSASPQEREGLQSAHHSTVRGFCNNVSSISPPPNSLNLHVHPSFLTAPNFILKLFFHSQSSVIDFTSYNYKRSPRRMLFLQVFIVII